MTTKNNNNIAPPPAAGILEKTAAAVIGAEEKNKVRHWEDLISGASPQPAGHSPHARVLPARGGGRREPRGAAAVPPAMPGYRCREGGLGPGPAPRGCCCGSRPPEDDQGKGWAALGLLSVRPSPTLRGLNPSSTNLAKKPGVGVDAAVAGE